MLQDDKAGALYDQSFTDLVVGRSVRSLPNEDARDLFAIFGAVPEDSLIPFGFVLVLWESIQPAAGTPKSSSWLKSSARKLVAVLVLNNLLHETAASYMMHDIGEMGL